MLWCNENSVINFSIFQNLKRSIGTTETTPILIRRGTKEDQKKWKERSYDQWLYVQGEAGYELCPSELFVGMSTLQYLHQ